MDPESQVSDGWESFHIVPFSGYQQGAKLVKERAEPVSVGANSDG